MRLERHYVDEVGKVLTRYLQDARSDCPGVDLIALDAAARAHIWKRLSDRDDLTPEYKERCIQLLMLGVQVVLLGARAWVDKEELLR